VAVGDARRDRGHHRDDPGVEHLADRAGRDLDHLAHVAAVGALDLLCAEDPVAVEGLGVRAQPAEPADDVGVDHVVEGAPDDLHRLLVGHALALDERRLVAGVPDGAGDRLAAAVHQHHLDADGVEEGEVAGNGLELLVELHHRPAELHEHHRAFEVLNVRQCLRKHRRLRLRCIQSIHEFGILYHIFSLQWAPPLNFLRRASTYAICNLADLASNYL
jgi:hypothetical protein